MTEHDELQQILENAPTMLDRELPLPRADGYDPTQRGQPSREAEVNFTQWEIGANDQFRATGGTRPHLPPGIYRLAEGNAGILFVRSFVVADKLIDLKDSVSAEIIEGIRNFWNSEDNFRRLGMLYKRGVLLWGPPGAGKTVTVSLLINQLVRDGGMVILCENPALTVMALAQVRRIEPDRRLIVVEEDIEEIMYRHGEHALLALLDGENQIANVVHVATTNYPEVLGSRIINRPSRFDEVKKIGMPVCAARLAYFEATIPNQALAVCEQWANDTDGMSIAHLRELVVAVHCLGRNYAETLDRLKKMQIRPKSHEDGFRPRTQVGIGDMSADGHA